jgi:hypothetical protein
MCPNVVAFFFFFIFTFVLAFSLSSTHSFSQKLQQKLAINILGDATLEYSNVIVDTTLI